LGVITTTTLACGLAQSQEALVIARFVQGIGGGMTTAVVLGMIVTMFQEPSDQAKAIGVYAFVASAGGSVGLLVGGVLTESINWHWVFFVNIPIGIGCAMATIRLIDKDQGIGFGEGADIPGAVLITSSLMLTVYTIVKPAAEQGWGASETLVLGAIALLLLAAFLGLESRIKNPLIPLGIFRARNVSGANVIQILVVPGMFGMFFLGALYLQQVLKYDALETGLAFLPATIIMGVLSLRYTERFVTRFGARTMLFPGLGLIAIALLLFARTPVDGDYFRHVLPVMGLFGFGAGICFPALMQLAMSGATPEDAGLASGLVNTTAQIGGALGLAVLATLAATRTEDLVADGVSMATALTRGYHLSYMVGAVLVGLAVLVTLFVIEPDKRKGGPDEVPVAPGFERVAEPTE